MDNTDEENWETPHTMQHNSYWRKSSRSNFNGNCVEIRATAASVLIRDSKKPGGVLQFDVGRWTAFIDRLRRASLEDSLP
jgi:hypothetical protein